MRTSSFYYHQLHDLILESKQWDIDVKFKRWFFSTYFPITDLVQLCMKENMIEYLDELMESPLYTLIFSGYPNYVQLLLKKANDAIRSSLR